MREGGGYLGGWTYLSSSTKPMEESPPATADSDVVALCVAAYECDTSRIRELLAAGTPVDALAREGHVSGYTALTAACGFAESTEVIDILLLWGAEIDRPNHYGRTPLMCSVINGSAKMCNHLLRGGAHLNLRHKNRMTVFDYAQKAVAESRNGPQREAAEHAIQALQSCRARRRYASLARHLRIKALVRGWSELLVWLHADVCFRPGGSGWRRCRDEFEACVQILGGNALAIC